MNAPASRRRPGRPLGADGAETRAKILHSARQVFATTGYERASLKQIAEDAGITRNAITNYYTSKSELYGAALASVALSAAFADFFLLAPRETLDLDARCLRRPLATAYMLGRGVEGVTERDAVQQGKIWAEGHVRAGRAEGGRIAAGQ